MTWHCILYNYTQCPGYHPVVSVLDITLHSVLQYLSSGSVLDISLHLVSEFNPWHHPKASVLDTRFYPVSGISPRLSDSCQCPGYHLAFIFLDITLCPEYLVPSLKSTYTSLTLTYLQNFWLGKCCYSNFPQHFSSTMYSLCTSFTGGLMWLPVVFDSTSWSWARSCPITFQVELDILTCITSSILILLHCLLLLFIVCISVAYLCQLNIMYYLSQLNVIIMFFIYHWKRSASAILKH